MTCWWTSALFSDMNMTHTFHTHINLNLDQSRRNKCHGSKQHANRHSLQRAGDSHNTFISASLSMQLCQEINHFLLHTKSYLKLRPHFWMRGKINRSIIGTRVRIRMGFTVWQRRDFSLTIYRNSFISHYSMYTTVKSRGSVRFYF